MDAKNNPREQITMNKSELIDRGIDFADAVDRAATKFDLDADGVEELEAEYDNQF